MNDVCPSSSQEILFAGKRVLVTGGGGFLGGHLARALARRGADVYVLDTNLHGVPGAITGIEGDVTDSESVTRAVEGCDLVFHYAALLGVERTLGMWQEVMRVNLGGTVNVAQACARAGVKRVILASSSEIYGEPSALPVSEDAPAQPRSAYGASKLAAEEACRTIASTSELDVTYLRYFNVYGPAQRGDFVIPRFLQRASRGEPPVVYGSGEQTRTYTYVSDAIRCTLLAAISDAGVGHCFNVGSRDTKTLRELARIVMKQFGLEGEPAARRLGEGIRSAAREINSRVPDTSKARAVLGFESHITLVQGLKRCLPVVEEPCRGEASAMGRRFHGRSA